MTEAEETRLKLMVVDDETDNLDLLYRTFRRDFQVYKAEDARTALEILEQVGEMAVIISDQRMPEMNGTEFLSLTVDKFPDTIRILLTGFTDAEDLVEAINSGKVFKYITKPWNPEDLRSTVEQAANTYRLVKKRTKELRRALKQEKVFNAITTAIRSSLDYHSMLPKIVATIGQSFEASCCLLKAVDGDRFTQDEFSYRDSHYPPGDDSLVADYWMEKVLETQEYQLTQEVHVSSHSHQLVVPLTYQKQLLAVLALYKPGETCPWTNEDIQLIIDVSQQAALALSQAKLYQRLQEKQQQISTELQVARQIQHNLLRQSLPDIPQAKVQACCYPAREVGGDFFEVFVHPKGDLWLAVGDVSGKGVPAALFMASAISVLRRELSQETPPEPNILLQNLNYGLANDLISNNCFITLVVARYTPISGELVYANAGHIYPLVWSRLNNEDKQPNYLKVRGIPLGIFPVWKAQAGRLTLESGDTLLLASDGITDAIVAQQTDFLVNTDSSNQPLRRSMLNQEGLWKLLQQEAQPFNLNNLIARIQAHNPAQEDDQTILSLEVL
jgi:serine phosphatase RsbU (regulator of sigma subunit)/FixJ family two-component response regulator